MMDIKEVLFQWFINSLITKTYGSGIKNENISNKRKYFKYFQKKIFQTQLHKIGQSGGFLGRLLGQLLKI